MMKRLSVFLILLLIIGMLGSGCSLQGNLDRDGRSGNSVLASEFALYKEVPVEERPSLKPYVVESDLGNIENAERFKFSDEAKAMLVKDGFVVIPELNQEFFMVYEINRYNGIPNLVTTDSMLHNYHLFFQHLLKTVEEEQLIPELKRLNAGMVKASEKQLKALEKTPWENAARRNLAFFLVGSRLLNPETPIPAAVKSEVNAELQLIKAHKETAISPVMNIGKTPDILESLKEDYTQYIPRGHYTRSEALQSYFQSMMWYGRMSFRLKDEDETRSAVLMTLALQDEQSAWDKIYSTTNFFVGRSDDPGCEQYWAVLKEVFGSDISLKKLSTDNTAWQKFLKEAKKIEGPAINSIPIFDASIQPDRDREIKGLRFMGQRYTVDADIFQRLIYREVGENLAGERRLLPKGLDIPAALGSGEASSILKDKGEYEYDKYPQNMGKLQEYLSTMETSTWHQNIYWNWMHTLRAFIREIPEGYPSFMLNQAWARKELNTFLGSWTELKHDTILYAKQVYAEMGGGGLDEVDDRGYVEPNPHLYARLASLSALTREGLQARSLLNERDAESLKRMEELAMALKVISEKELQGQSLTEADYELIETFGGQLEHFWLEALREQESQGRNQLLTNNPAMLVADVATAPPDLVLEEATGYIQALYAIVPVEGGLRIAKGGVYSYYEFPWPAQNRLTDQKWREMLSSGDIPAAPSWISSFKVENGECRVIMPWEEK